MKEYEIRPEALLNRYLELSAQDAAKCLQRAGLVDITVSTPGQLDVDIVRNAVQRNPALLQEQRFLNNLLADANAATFQRFLAEHPLSSHVWVMGRKPTGDGTSS